MRRLHARDLLNCTSNEIWGMPDERFTLVFDDGELVTTTRRTIFSWYHWQVIYKYSKCPLNMSHHIGDRHLTSDTTLDILSSFVRCCHDAYNHDFEWEELWKLIYDIVNEIYNVFVVKCEAYQTSSNILDYLEIYFHPPIHEVNKNLQPNQLSITGSYNVIEKEILKSDELRDNPVAQAARGKLVKIDQVCQIVGARGYMTDIDSNMFEEPILVGYLEGITSLYDALIESRSAVKALSFTKKPLRDVEYFNRKMQLSTVVVHTLLMSDCGSNEYVEVKVTASIFKGIEGKRYLDEKRGLTTIYAEDRHLIGKTIQMRSPMLCRHRGDGKVCVGCFGEIGYSVPKKTNVGHVSSTEMCHEASQLVMSVKHYDGSSVVMEIDISDYEKRYIAVSKTKSGHIKLNPDLKAFSPFLLLESSPAEPAEGAAGISSIKSVAEIEHASIHRLTSFREVAFEVTNDHGERMADTVSVSSGPRLGSLTKEFLAYTLEQGYEITDDGYYRIDLAGWNFEQEIFALPLKHLNMLDYMNEMEAVLRSSSDSKKGKGASAPKKLITYTSAQEALLDLYELVSQRLSVNMVHLEVILLSLMRSTEENNYNLPHFGQPAKFETHSKLMDKRSGTGVMAYQNQPNFITDVNSYLRADRPAHVLDPLMI